ncbi:MAG: glycoside hydrolase family 13 protein [Acidimicrobiales bacterium]
MLNEPHHDPSVNYVSTTSPRPGETVVVEVAAPAEIDQMLLRTMIDGEAQWIEGARQGERWTFALPCHNAVVNYRFWFKTGEVARWLTGIGCIDHDPLDHHDFRLLTTGGAPEWVTGTVWYQIFPDRFASSGKHNQDLPDWAWHADWADDVAEWPESMTQIFGGDLDGIIERLDYLADLGITGVYLTPIFPARSNHRYDAQTFDRVDPLLGGDEALIRLKAACDDRGMRLMTDLTLNHTGDAHEWFVAAQADANSDEAGFYYFADHPSRYETWLGVDSLPKLNHSSAELARRFYDGPDSIVAKYLRLPFDLAGWRIDVANMTGRLGQIDHNEKVRRSTRATMAEVDEDRWLVAEHFFDASRDAGGDGWHGVMNYTGIARPIVSWLGNFSTLAAMSAGPGQDVRDGEAVAKALDEVRASMPWQITIGSMALLSSHDTARWRTMARSDELAKIGFGLLCTLPGTPCFFFGDEVGLEAPDAEKSRRTMPWDEARWDMTFLEWYRTMIRTRTDSSALAVGGMRWVERAADALTFLRESRDQRLLVRACRAATDDLVLDLNQLRSTTITRLVGTGTAVVDGSSVTFSSDGPSFAVFQLAD